MNYGFPQESILGPTFFLVYIDQLCEMLIENSQIITFTDDALCLFWDRSWEGVSDNGQKGLNEITE